MSEYSYHDRSRHRHRTLERECEPQYMSAMTYMARGGRGAAVHNLVHRPACEEIIEDVPRNFPPPGAGSREEEYRENVRPRRGDHDYSDDYYHRRDRVQPSRDYDDYSDHHERGPKPQRRKSVVDNLKEHAKAANVGGVIGAITGRRSIRSSSQGLRKERHDRDYDSEYDSRYVDDRRRDRCSSSERSRSRGGKSKKNKKWEQAAKNPDKHGKRHVVESAIGGLVASRFANGSRGPGHDGSHSPLHSRSGSRSISGRSQSRGRSASREREERGKSTLKDVAGAGAVLAAGKALRYRMHSKSRRAERHDRSRSVSSQDSYVPSRNRRNRGYSDRGRSVDGYSNARGSADQGCRQVVTAGTGALAKGKCDGSDSESTTDMEQKRIKLKRKELLTAGLATVATIQAARGVYTSMAASDNRRKLLSAGEISLGEARRRKSKNILQDTVAVGIASLGIKSAFSKWKEMNEQRYSVKEIETRHRKRRNIRKHLEKEVA